MPSSRGDGPRRGRPVAGRQDRLDAQPAQPVTAARLDGRRVSPTASRAAGRAVDLDDDRGVPGLLGAPAARAQRVRQRCGRLVDGVRDDLPALDHAVHALARHGPEVASRAGSASPPGCWRACGDHGPAERVFGAVLHRRRPAAAPSCRVRAVGHGRTSTSVIRPGGERARSCRGPTVSMRRSRSSARGSLMRTPSCAPRPGGRQERGGRGQAQRARAGHDEDGDRRGDGRLAGRRRRRARSRAR